ncbi:MAG: hypothetical protein K8S54_15330 [Spirochaetia bacterium]|nr:hypothetical protein [Spirochaetia bacterium]
MNESLQLPLWKVKPSERDGFHKTYYTVTPDEDQIIIDSNHARQMVRIQLTIAREGGRQYACVIKSGTILQERDITVGRPMELTARMFPFRQLIGAIPDSMLRRTIGGNYGIPTTAPASTGTGRVRLVRIPRVNRFQRFLRKKRAAENRPGAWYQHLFRRLPAEAFQVGCVCALALGYFHQLLSTAQFACLVGFFGLWSGAYDWLVRQKNPFIPRVAGMLGVSAYAVWLQVQYRIWGIFLN